MSLFLNGAIPVLAARFRAWWCGAWTADLDLAGDVVPAGRVVLAGATGISAVGTVDPKRSGTFGERRFVRIVGGGGGWSRVLPAKDYHSDVALPLASVVSTTAAEAGEVATVLAPGPVRTHYAREAGRPAAQVLWDAGLDWWVGLDGVTKVGARVPSPAPPTLTVLDWLPEFGAVTFTAETLPEPGMLLADLRFGTKIVREVEATIEGGAVSGTLRVADAPPSPGSSAGELADLLAASARAACRPTYGRLHEYRVIAMAADRVELQAVKSRGDVPDVLPASVWGGISGYRAALAPSSRVLVGFIAGDPGRPFVAFYEPPEGGEWRPVSLELDATGSLVLGERAVAVVLGASAGDPTAFPVARVTSSLTTWIGAVSAFINGLAPGTCVPPGDLASAKVGAA